RRTSSFDSNTSQPCLKASGSPARSIVASELWTANACQRVPRMSSKTRWVIGAGSSATLGFDPPMPPR
ncbi:MAG: hypothetical protein ACREOK_09170, partial [Gemmatimonadaceae bacterium]